MQPVTILFLAANPAGKEAALLDRERRDISLGLERARLRDQFKLETRWAITTRELLRALLEVTPDIVQISGLGGDESGVVLETPDGNPCPVEALALAELFRLCSDRVRCVLLAAGGTVEAARAISQYIDFTIGMDGALQPYARVEFSVAFYTALAARRPVRTAFEFGRVGIQLAGHTQHELPTLFEGEGARAWPAEEDRGLGDTGRVEHGVGSREQGADNRRANADNRRASADNRRASADNRRASADKWQEGAGSRNERGDKSHERNAPPQRPRESVRPGDRALIVQADREILLPFADAFDRLARVPRRWDAFVAKELREAPPNQRIWRRYVEQTETAIKDLIAGLSPGASLHLFVMAPHAAALLAGERLGRLARDVPITLWQWNDHEMRWAIATWSSDRWDPPDAKDFFHVERVQISSAPGTLLTLEAPHRVSKEQYTEIAQKAGVGHVYRLIGPYSGARMSSTAEIAGAIAALLEAIAELDQPPFRRPLHIASSGPVMLLLELGRRLRQNVEPEVVAWHYDARGASYFPILEVMSGEALIQRSLEFREIPNPSGEQPASSATETAPTSAASDTTPTSAASDTAPTSAASDTTPTSAASDTEPTSAASKTGPAFSRSCARVTKAPLPPVPSKALTDRMRKTLAPMFSDVLIIQMLVEDAGLPWERIPHGGSPESIWRNVLKEASIQGFEAVSSIVETALERYPRNSQLRQLELDVSSDRAKQGE